MSTKYPADLRKEYTFHGWFLKVGIGYSNCKRDQMFE